MEKDGCERLQIKWREGDDCDILSKYNLSIKLNSKFKSKFCIQILEEEKVGDGCDRLRGAADVEADTISQLCL